MIGIVILNHENWEDSRRCAESIRTNPPDEDYAVILVDNASVREPDFDLPAFLGRHRIIFLKQKENRGYNAGNNAGIARALELGCSSILISNSDVRYLPGSIQRMKDCLDRHPQAGIAGPRILDQNGSMQKCCLCCRTGMKEKYMVRTRAGLLFRRRRRAYFGLGRDYGRPFRAYAVLGCCFMMSRACAEAVAPFDEHPLLYEEELMLGIRMEEAGLWTIYEPAAAVVHLHGGSTGLRKAFSFAHNVRSEIYYCRQYLHAGRAQIYPLYFYRTALYLIRCLRYEDFRRNWRQYRRMTMQELAPGRTPPGGRRTPEPVPPGSRRCRQKTPAPGSGRKQH